MEPYEQNIWRTPNIWHIDCVQGVVDLVTFWQNSVNIWLNCLPFLTLAYCIVKQPYEQISREPLELGSCYQAYVDDLIIFV